MEPLNRPSHLGAARVTHQARAAFHQAGRPDPESHPAGRPLLDDDQLPRWALMLICLIAIAVLPICVVVGLVLAPFCAAAGEREGIVRR